MSAGRVGRAHGLDGSFYVEAPARSLSEASAVEVAGGRRRVERRGGTSQRPLLRLAGVDTREAAVALRGAELLVEEGLSVEQDELRVADLVGCEVPGLGIVARVLPGPSCDVLELEGGELVPLVSDAIRRVDLTARRVEVDLRFLGKEPA